MCTRLETNCGRLW